MAEYLELAQPVIIAMKGLPCTGKAEIARCIGGWLRCPVLHIDHFLDTLSFEKGYTAESLPCPDEAERLHRLAFDRLCKAASDYLRWGVDTPSWGYKSVVVKSRLSSTFELSRLVQLARERGCRMILIIEFQTNNEHRVRNRLECKIMSGEQKEWYKPRSWIDVEKFRDDYLDSQANSWDLHLLSLLDNGDEISRVPRVKRLVLDPFDHLYLYPYAEIPFDFGLTVRYLLRGHLVGEDSDKEDLLLQGRNVVVQYEELGRYLREKELRDALSRERNTWSCTNTIGNRQCTFKYWEELQVDNENLYYCGVCEELVVSGQSAYTCYYCIITLHKSCAEMLTSVTVEGFKGIEFLRLYPNCDDERLPQRYACKKEHYDFCPSCMACFSPVADLFGDQRGQWPLR